jgi:hypothetical protein
MKVEFIDSKMCYCLSLPILLWNPFTFFVLFCNELYNLKLKRRFHLSEMPIDRAIHQIEIITKTNQMTIQQTQNLSKIPKP